jgi:hypothetical protein
MNASSAMLGIVWTTPRPPIVAEREAKRDAEQHRGGERDADEQHMTQGERAQVSALGPQLIGERRTRRAHSLDNACGGVGQSEVGERILRDDRHANAVHLDATVERPHSRHVESSAQEGEDGHGIRAIPRETRTDQRRRVVGREDVPVVFQGDEIIARDQGVGRISIDDIDVAGSEGLVLQRRRERPNVARPDSVRTSQGGQSIGTTDEIRREAGAQPRAGATEVRQGAEPVSNGGLPPNGDRVAVLEAERRQPSHVPASRKFVSHERVGRAAPAAQRVGERVVQHRDEARSRVLGIDIDRTALQRAEGDLSGTEPGTAIDRDAA